MQVQVWQFSYMRFSPNISIIIPTLNEQDYIGQTLHALSIQTSKPKEIIVVDAHSRDRTQQVVKKYPNVRLITHSPSVALQRNMGAKKAIGDILMFLDADVYPGSDFIISAIMEFKNKNLDCACPVYIPSSKKTSTKYIFQFFNKMFSVFEKRAASGAGCCIIVKKSLWQQLGGFANFKAYEDIEFIRRASKAGKFGMLKTPLIVSDRRFIKYGVLVTFLKYLALSLFFITGQFKAAQHVHYQFGVFNKR